MRIRILTPIAGNDFSWAPGSVVDLPPEEAKGWADGERAEYVDAPQTASVEAPENAAMKRPRARKS